MLRSCFLWTFIEFCSMVSEEKEKMSNVNEKMGWPFCFSDHAARKTQTWKRKLRSFFLSSFFEFCSAVSEEKFKMSQRIRGQGGHLVFPISPEKHKIGRGRWNLASCHVSLNFFQRFQRRSWKCLSKSEARVAILFFWLGRKTQTW